MGNRISADTAREILNSFFAGEWVCTNDNLGSTTILLNGELIRLFIVGQTQSYAIESERGHLFSPTKGYPNMLKVQPKDIIFHYNNGYIRAISIALEAAEETFGKKDGLRIDNYFSELQFPLDVRPLRSTLAGYTPFGPTGKLPQRGYIHPLHAYAARRMLMEIKKLGCKPRV